jgi:hypothetical protein
MDIALNYRIEPAPATEDIEEGLAAPLHDALWLLTRQWQLGEFHGDDAGSPALVRVRGETTAIGAVASGVDGTWRKYDRTQLPLDVSIEAEGGGPDLRARAQAGAHFPRLLARDGLERYAREFHDACAFDPRHVSTNPLLALMMRNAPDPERLEALLEPFVADNDAAPTFVRAADRTKMRAVAREWLVWLAAEKGCTETPPSHCWEPNRLEHHVLLASSAADGTVLRAREYCGDSLDWVDFDIDATAPAPNFGLPKPRKLALSGIPAPIRYGGMPAARYWELEDGRVDFGRVEAGAHDIGRLLLVQFSLVFGNDWFLVPLRIASGTLTSLADIVVTDVFGEHHLLQRAGDVDPNWDLFALESKPGETHASQSALLMPPSFGLRLESEPLESVHLLRDEMANLAWAVERRVATEDGGSVDRLAQWRRRDSSEPVTDESLPRYLVETEVPDYWLPMVPEQLADRRSHRLVLVPLAARTDAGIVRSTPHGGLLAAPARDEPFWLFEEEVPRAGVAVDRTRRYLRWHGGRAYLWSARSKRTGRGEGSSGLRFDVVLPQ